MLTRFSATALIIKYFTPYVRKISAKFRSESLNGKYKLIYVDMGGR
jgi:hypothetical protein